MTNNTERSVGNPRSTRSASRARATAAFSVEPSRIPNTCFVPCESTPSAISTQCSRKNFASTNTTAMSSSASVHEARRETLGVLRSVDPGTLSRCSVSRVTNARVDRVVVEAYALTSADLVRPRVEVYLRGVADAPEVPESWLAWRRDVADLVRAGPAAAELARVPVTEAQKNRRGGDWPGGG